jgi:hypothetical protein
MEMSNKPKTFDEALSGIKEDKRASDLQNLAIAYARLDETIDRAQKLQARIKEAAADEYTPLEIVKQLYNEAQKMGVAY